MPAAVIDEYLNGLEQFGRVGLAPLVEPWRSVDALRDQQIKMSEAGESHRGVARGIDAQGLLQLEEVRGRVSGVQGGEVSVRRRASR